MRTSQESIDRTPQDEPRYALRRDLGFWDVTFEGREATFNHEPGALYAACLLLHPPPQPIHALALALDARSISNQPPGAAEVILQRSLELDAAETIRALRRRQHGLEAVLDDEDETEPVKAEVLRELEGIADSLRRNSWRHHQCARKCARAVSLSIHLLLAHFNRALDDEGNPHPVLQAFARHLERHLLVPSGLACLPGEVRVAAAFNGWFTYEPPPGVDWAAGEGLSPK
jgi:hypothetical protein